MCTNAEIKKGEEAFVCNHLIINPMLDFSSKIDPENTLYCWCVDCIKRISKKHYIKAHEAMLFHRQCLVVILGAERVVESLFK